MFNFNQMQASPAQPVPGMGPKYDPTFTDRVIAATGPKAHLRLAEIMPCLIRHLHDFAREVNLTHSEWMAAIELINTAGRISDDRRNETQLLCDILGLESLVDDITSKKQQAASNFSTPSAILGPFYRKNAPILPNGSSIIRPSNSISSPPSPPWTDADPGTRPGSSYSPHIGDTVLVTGRVLSLNRRGWALGGGLPARGKSPPAEAVPLAGAIVDVWHAAPNGLYEQQDVDQPDMNLRGRFRTGPDGRYCFYCLRPTPYPIPDDGPAGTLLVLLDRHPHRPAHIHFRVSAPGHHEVTTQVFDRQDPFLSDDAVFAVKDELIVDFVRREGDARACWTLTFDFVLDAD